MKKFKNQLIAVLTICLAATLFSCNNNTEKKEEPVKAADTTVAMVTPPAPAPFTPFDVVVIKHLVKDYATWRPGFNADSTARKASGLGDIIVGRGMENTNSIFIALNASDVQKAKARQIQD